MKKSTHNVELPDISLEDISDSNRDIDMENNKLETQRIRIGFQEFETIKHLIMSYIEDIKITKGEGIKIKELLDNLLREKIDSDEINTDNKAQEFTNILRATVNKLISDNLIIVTVDDSDSLEQTITNANSYVNKFNL